MLKQIKKLEVTVDANNIITAITTDKNTDFFNQYITQAYSQVFYQPNLFGVDEAVNDEVVYLKNTIEDTPIYYFILSKEQCNGGYQYGLINISNVINTAENIIAYKEDEKNEVVDLIPAPVYWKDRKGTYLKVNQFTLGQSFASSRKIVGENDVNLWPNYIVNEYREHDQLVIQTGKEHIFEETVVFEDQVTYFVAHKRPTRDYHGNITGITGVSIDITDIKRYQQKLEQKNQALEEKDQLKKQFIKSFSHDVKLPINAIVGSTQLLLILAKEHIKLKEIAQKVDNGVMALNSMFEQIYEVMVHEEFGSKCHNKDFDFKKMITAEMALAEASLKPGSKIHLSYDIDEKIPDKLNSDAFKVAQILRNLLSNAIAYTNEGTVTLKAEMLRQTADTVVLKFTVADTGRGIKEEDQGKVYDYGQRLVRSYQENIHGSGLGLYMVKQHINTLAGKISFDSIYGKGTQFYVEITFNAVKTPSPAL